MTPVTTALRSVGTVDADGVRHLGPVRLTYSDGSEERVLALLRSATDLGSDSRALVESASGWAERYHTHPDRANVLRAFDLPADLRVLEVGAGCGAVTRYLGEHAALVDALEPMPARARAARERTRDLPNVDIAVGEVADMPAAADYDLVVVIGVLEYVGFGARDDTERLSFLRAIRARLAPGGTLLLAIENKLGVKYLAGAPEDHTRGVYDGIEGYPSGGGARTFSRRELSGLLTAAGFTPQVHGAFPDYKMTRVVFSPEIAELDGPAASLVAELPEFPSPDWTGDRPRGVDEGSLWRQVTDAGLAGEFANSFVALARTDGDAALWPSDRLATAFSTQRAAGFTCRIDLRREGGALLASRTWSGGTAGDPDVGQVDQIGAFVPGQTLLEAVADADFVAGDDIAALFTAWRLLADDGDPGAPALLADDLVVGADGALTPTHAGIRVAGWSASDALQRGILLLGLSVALRTPPHRWPGAETVGDIVRRLGDLAVLPEGWLDEAVVTEATWRAKTRTVSPLGGPSRGHVAEWESLIRGELDRNIWSLPLGHREHDVTAHLRSQLQGGQ